MSTHFPKAAKSQLPTKKRRKNVKQIREKCERICGHTREGVREMVQRAVESGPEGRKVLLNSLQNGGGKMCCNLCTHTGERIGSERT